MLKSLLKLQQFSRPIVVRYLCDVPSRSFLKKILLEAKRSKGLTFDNLSKKLEVNKIWLTAVILGQHPFHDHEKALSLMNILGIPEKDCNRYATLLCNYPYDRGVRDESATKDPIIRRFDELLDIYGEAFKEIIREEAGDGIMSAIDCTVDLKKIEKNGETRIVLNVDGKFLKYKH